MGAIGKILVGAALIAGGYAAGGAINNARRNAAEANAPYRIEATQQEDSTKYEFVADGFRIDAEKVEKLYDFGQSIKDLLADAESETSSLQDLLE